MPKSPSTILAAIDEFDSKKYLMNIGPRKSVMMINFIAELKLTVMVEPSGYIGYSAILFGDAINTNGSQRYVSIKCNAEFAQISRQLVELAGLSHVVTIEVGVSDDILGELTATSQARKSICCLLTIRSLRTRTILLFVWQNKDLSEQGHKRCVCSLCAEHVFSSALSHL